MPGKRFGDSENSNKTGDQDRQAAKADPDYSNIEELCT
jgi:hypothetical protein